MDSNTRVLSASRALLCMLATIWLHDQLGVGAKEIDDETIDWHLPLELPSCQTAIAQSQPQQTLGMRLIAAQPPRGLGAHSRHPTPLTPTLSPAGRGSTPCSRLDSSFSPCVGRSPSKWQTA